MTHALSRYELVFKTPFRLAHGTRTGTQALLLALSEKGVTGYGEATFPPYLAETPAASAKALEQVLPGLELPRQLAAIGPRADAHALSPFTRNILVNALTDLYLRVHNLSLHALQPPNTNTPQTTLTLTKNDWDQPGKYHAAQDFSLLKLKLDGHADLEFARQVVTLYRKPFCADANQGWEKPGLTQAAEMARELKNMGCVLIEQPFDKNNHAQHAALSAMNILPVYADEGIQGPEDFAAYGHFYDGINIKLLKCGGMDRALQMATAAAKAGKHIIAGCMSESSCGCAAALVLKPLARYLDLDGPWLITNDPFTGLNIHEGELSAKGPSGIGVDLR